MLWKLLNIGQIQNKPKGRGLQNKPMGRGSQNKPMGRGLQNKPMGHGEEMSLINHGFTKIMLYLLKQILQIFNTEWSKCLGVKRW